MTCRLAVLLSFNAVSGGFWCLSVFGRASAALFSW